MLVKAGKTLAEGEKHSWDWDRIVRENKASNWKFVPVGCQWRNGFVERMVATTKNSLDLALPRGRTPTYSEMVTLLARITNSINSRPIGVYNKGDQSSEIQPITPNMLLLGRSEGKCNRTMFDISETLPQRCMYVRDLLNSWWSKWYSQVFPHLIPCKKWQHRASNLEVGDICQMFYPGAMVDMYRLVKVTNTFPDKNGLVRSVEVTYRPNRTREKRDKCDTKKVTEIVGVQRLSLLLKNKEEDFKQNVTSVEQEKPSGDLNQVSPQYQTVRQPEQEPHLPDRHVHQQGGYDEGSHEVHQPSARNRRQPQLGPILEGERNSKGKGQAQNPNSPFLW